MKSNPQNSTFKLVFLATCFLCLLWISTVESKAQTSIGIRGGLSYSGMKYRPIPSIPDIKVNGVKELPTFGFVIEHFFVPHAGVQIEGQYLTTGFMEINENDQVNETQLDYAKIPFLANFYFGRTGRFHIKMGPHFGYLLEARDVSREHEAVNQEIPILPTYGQPGDNPRKFMYGLTAGSGISKVFGKHTLQAEVRVSYEFGRPEGQDRIFDMTGTNLEFSVAYLFAVLKRKY